MFRWPQLIAVTDLASARAAIDEIIEQGEGARGDWQPAHYGRFLGIWNEYQKLREQDPSFEPARPVIPAFTQQPFDIDQPQPLLTEPVTREVAELFNLAYEVLLQVLTRFFTHTDETDEQLDALVQAAFRIMGGVLQAAGHRTDAATCRAREPRSHGRPRVPDVLRDGELRAVARAAWVLLSERAAVLATRSAGAAALPGAPAAVSDAATAAASIAAQFLAQVPQELRHVR